MFRKILWSITIIISFASCVNTRKVLYFDGQADATLPSNITIPQSVIIASDILSITVSSLNSKDAALFNAPNIAYSSNTTNKLEGSLQVPGFLVDQDGNIQFPILGTIKAAGLTEAALKNQITKAINDKKLLVDPIVTVRHLNFRVTVLGEVSTPTVINVASEKISLLEALGLAGDITIYGKKENVLIIREESGQKIIKRINLNTSEIFNSSYYYLRSNDIVYVEPNKAKVANASRSYQLLPIILSGLSFAAIIIDRLTR